MGYDREREEWANARRKRIIEIAEKLVIAEVGREGLDGLWRDGRAAMIELAFEMAEAFISRAAKEPKP